ncbi:MAG: hypothetical protein B6I25_08580 [Planctomycetales bacterium 4572_13]|nr:MAG: hypothetical protein B6I25_08580 [Planctomycetales bacterium 4572_13]
MEYTFEIMNSHNSGNPKATAIHCQHLIRIISGLREVYEGHCNGQIAIIKIFLSKLHGKRHYHRESRGLRKLASRGLATPTILAQGKNENGDYVLVLEKIKNAQELFAVIDHAKETAETISILKRFFEFIAKMHQAGIDQRDFNLGNFLWDGSMVYAIDPAQIHFYSSPLNKQKSLWQLAGLFAGRSGIFQENKAELLNTYFKVRGWELDNPTLQKIEKLAAKKRHLAIKRHLKKILRTSKHTAKIRHEHYVSIFQRPFFDQLGSRKFTKKLDALMEAGIVLKDGISTRVVRCVYNGWDIVIKRYNYQGLWHSLRHTIKGSRAKKCWRFGHLLTAAGIGCAAPLGIVEERRFGMIRQSYIINAFVAGPLLYVPMNDPNCSPQQRHEIVQKAEGILEQLGQNRLTHSDMKSSNMIISEGQPVLIDLDSMRRHHRKGPYFKNRYNKMLRTFHRRLDGKK